MKVGAVLTLWLLLNIVFDMLMQTLVACIIELREGDGLVGCRGQLFCFPDGNFACLFVYELVH